MNECISSDCLNSAGNTDTHTEIPVVVAHGWLNLTTSTVGIHSAIPSTLSSGQAVFPPPSCHTPRS